MARRRRIPAKVIQPKTEIVSVRFTREQLDAIEQRAERAGVSLADYIRAQATPSVEPGACVINYGAPQTYNAAPMRLVVKEAL